MDKQWYRMTTSEVLEALSVDITKGVTIGKHTMYNKPFFIPKNAWPLYVYKVLRNGAYTHIRADKLIVGDIIRFNIGDIVPATVRLLESRSLAVQDDNIIGGSGLSYKHTFASKSLLPISDQKNMLFAGSRIQGGSAKGIVVGLAQQSKEIYVAKPMDCIKKPYILVKNSNVKSQLKHVTHVYFDDLQQPDEIVQLVQKLYLQKNIQVSFFVHDTVARNLTNSLPKTAFMHFSQSTSLLPAGIRVWVGLHVANKAKIIKKTTPRGATSMYVYRGNPYQAISKITDISATVTEHARQIAIYEADVLIPNISVATFSSILYNKKIA